MAISSSTISPNGLKTAYQPSRSHDILQASIEKSSKVSSDLSLRWVLLCSCRTVHTTRNSMSTIIF